jgi:hypothetical protein
MSYCVLALGGALAVAAQTPADSSLLRQDNLLRSSRANPVAAPRLDRSLTSLRIPFVAADGRDPRVAYSASTFAGTVFVTREGKIVYSLPSGKGEKKQGWTIAESAVRGKARPRGDGMTPTHVSSFTGNDPSRWRTDVPTYDAVSLGEVWPGIDVRLRAQGRTSEKLFVVNPGAKASRIRMNVSGVRSLKVNRDGELVATTGLGDVMFSRPVAYQEIAGARRAVEVAYDVRGNRYGFRLGDHDPAFPVIVDPLLQATFLGGTQRDANVAGMVMTIHPSSREIYAAGDTFSTDFPGTAGGAQSVGGGGFVSHDAFIARLSADLTVLEQATYLGGGSDDFATALAIHPTSGDVYVAGSTHSRDFPGASGGVQDAPASCGLRGCNEDTFVARLNADLTVLRQSTYLGGTNDDRGEAIAIHPANGDVYVVGLTESSRDFPGTAGGAQPAGKSDDAFVARLNPDLTILDQATFLGGVSTERPHALAISAASGEVYVAGETDSPDFPGTTGGAQETRGDNSSDAFVARLSADLTALEQSTYLGGDLDDAALALAIHPTSGDVYLAGETRSTLFPGTDNSAQPQHGSDLLGRDAFVSRLSGDLTTLRQSTFLGGGSNDVAQALAIHPVSGEVYVAGSTSSEDFPGTNGGVFAEYVHGVDQEAFVARMNAGLTALDQSTYLGGVVESGPAASTLGKALGISSTGDVYVAGFTFSAFFSGTIGGAQETPGGQGDGFVAVFTPDLEAPPVLNSFVSFVPIRSTYTRPSYSLFRFEARLTNTSHQPLSHLAVKVVTLTSGDFLANSDLGPQIVGALMTVRPTGDYEDRVLGPGESVDVPFEIILGYHGGPFTLFVDVVGIAEESEP